MASLQQVATGTYHIVIFHGGKRHKRSLGTKKESQALVRKEEIEETLDLIKRGRISIPESISLIDFAMGKTEAAEPPVPPKPPSTPPPSPEPTPSLTIEQLLNRFFDSIPSDSLEENTLATMGTHRKHLLRLLPKGLTVAVLTGEHLQQYINKRAKEPTQRIRDKTVAKKKQKRVPVSATTIRKEIVTLGSAWRWAISIDLIQRTFPNKGLRWPKTDEKPPFQTWSEIERQLELDDLTTSEVELLWDCLYLRHDEIAELLTYVKGAARYPYVFPFYAVAAYTGARRSELLRSRKSDFNFDTNIITIRERKRVRGKRTTRRVPICQKLQPILADWFAEHPGTQWTFSLRERDGHISKVTGNKVQKQFISTLNKSRWSVMSGWHCLRHSFISNLASAGVDQRIIDDFVGHTTEEMRRRYRHLFPDVKQAALDGVFGDAL